MKFSMELDSVKNLLVREIFKAMNIDKLFKKGCLKLN